MLEGLDKIDWGRLTHAFGEASDVPDLIRALASPKQEDRENALGALYGNIWHQGTVYEATAYAVPFLIELLETPSVKGKPEILAMLQAISQGSSYLDAHQDMEWYRDERKLEEFAQEREQELEWVRAACRAVSVGTPTYLRLLKCPSPCLRLYALFPLGCCLDQFFDVEKTLRNRLKVEKHPVVKAGIVWVWARLGASAIARQLCGETQGKEIKRKLRKLSLSRKERPLVRLMAALGLLVLLPLKNYPNLIRFLTWILDKCGDSLGKLPWAQVEGDTFGFIVHQVLPKKSEALFQLLINMIRNEKHSLRKEAFFFLEEYCREHWNAIPRVVPILAELLKDADANIRIQAARSLGGVGSFVAMAREPLLRALKDSNSEVALHAAVALSKLGEPTAIPFLVKRLTKGADLNQIFEALKSFGSAAKEAITPLRGLLSHYNSQIRIRACHVLAAIGEPAQGTISEVAKLLHSPDTGGGAAWALAQWGTLAKTAVPELIRFLQSQNPESFARINSIKALGTIGFHSQETRLVLEGYLDHPDPETRVTAALAMWKINPNAKQVIPVLLSVLKETQGKDDVVNIHNIRCSLAQAFEVIGPPAASAIPLLRQLLDDTYQWTRIHAARALWKMGDNLDVFLPRLIDELRCRPVGILAAECLAEIGPPAAAAIPRLQALSNLQDSISEGGGLSEIISQEEGFRSAIAKALKRIQGT